MGRKEKHATRGEGQLLNPSNFGSGVKKKGERRLGRKEEIGEGL